MSGFSGQVVNSAARGAGWAKWPRDQLLDMRICDLGLTIKGGPLQALMAQLHRELEQRAFAFRSHVWLSDAQREGFALHPSRTSSDRGNRRALDGYARMDLCLAQDNVIYVLEANPNPAISSIDDFAFSALKVGVSYPDLIQRILNLGLRAHAART